MTENTPFPENTPESAAPQQGPYSAPQQPTNSAPANQQQPYGQNAAPFQQGAQPQQQYPQPGAGYAGPAQAGYPSAEPGPSRMLAGLMGIFFGGLGVHRFILGYTTIGIVQILVTLVTCGAGSLWGFIEGIMILAKADAFRTDANGRPLSD